MRTWRWIVVASQLNEAKSQNARLMPQLEEAKRAVEQATASMDESAKQISDLEGKAQSDTSSIQKLTADKDTVQSQLDAVKGELEKANQTATEANVKMTDRVVVPFTISCGECWFCQAGLFSCCDRTNPNAEMAIKAMGHSPAGLFGFSHMLGGYSGGQAEYLRVPMADVGPIKVPDSLSDEQALFLSDIFPTGYMAAENAQIEDGDTVAVWGCGPVGQFAIRSALMMGAGRVIAIDEVPERLAMAEAGGAETIDFSETDVYDELMARTNKRGPDSCIDAVGCEASGHGAVDAVVDKVKAATYLATDRVHVIREAIMCCRKAGTISVPGVYVGMGDKIPLGAAMNKGLTIKSGQTHVQAYTKPLLEKIEAGEIDPSFVVTHPASLEDAPAMYKKFRDKEDGVIKVVLRPNMRPRI